MDKLALALILGMISLPFLAYGLVMINFFPIALMGIPQSEYYLTATSLCIGLALIIGALFLYRSIKRDSKMENDAHKSSGH